jgi:hypothetical protein
MTKPRRKGGESFATESATLRQSIGDTAVASADRDRIAARAYELYLARGGRDGMDMDDWLNAEREVRGGSEGSNRDH